MRRLQPCGSVYRISLGGARRTTLECVTRKLAKRNVNLFARKKSVRTKRSSPARIVNITHLGDVVNLKERRLHMLRHEGMPQISPGRFDLGACCRWYVRFLQRKLLERANPKESATAARRRREEHNSRGRVGARVDRARGTARALDLARPSRERYPGDRRGDPQTLSPISRRRSRQKSSAKRISRSPK